MGRYSWSQLNKQQVGRFAEYFVKMEFALYGFEVYTAEVDDRGIDFVARYGAGGFYEVQVKSVRSSNYVFMHKSRFPLRPDRLLALVLLEEDQPLDLYLIPATAWLSPNALLVGRDYDGLKSKPEWGVQLSRGNSPLLSPYHFDSVVVALCEQAEHKEDSQRGVAPDLQETALASR